MREKGQEGPMLLYLVRHGEAQSEPADPSQSLSERGLRDVQKMAVHLAGLNLPIDSIFHSRKMRAKQTALVFAEFLKPREGIQETEDLAPLDDPSVWEQRLRDRDMDIMLVSHLPYLPKLFSLLTCSFIDDSTITFGNASVACLKKQNNGSWLLRWMLGPEVVGSSCGT
jgi:phosphohistidine phosphatase